jgi:hypothetical protein
VNLLRETSENRLDGFPFRNQINSHRAKATVLMRKAAIANYSSSYKEPEVKPTKQRKPDPGEKHVERVRRICLALPGAIEKLSHGEPTFFVKKVFAMCSINHHNDGHIAVTVPAAIGVQEMLIQRAPEKFYRPPYVGVNGWVGIELPRVSDKELAFHIHEAWRLIAPKKLQQE